MKNIALLALPLALVACAPAQTQAVVPPVTYVAAQDAVFNTVLQVIATDPGVPNYKHAYNLGGENMERIPSGGWDIVSADKTGGFIRATAQSTLVFLDGSDSGRRETHSISASITSSGANTVVTVSPSERAGYLRTAIFAKLDATYPRAK